MHMFKLLIGSFVFFSLAVLKINKQNVFDATYVFAKEKYEISS